MRHVHPTVAHVSSVIHGDGEYGNREVDDGEWITIAGMSLDEGFNDNVIDWLILSNGIQSTGQLVCLATEYRQLHRAQGSPVNGMSELSRQANT